MSPYVVGALALVVVCAGCGGGPGSPTPPPAVPDIEVLDGTVIDALTQQPLADAVVSVHDGPNAGRSTTTDVGGRFLMWLEVGGFTLDVRRAGYDDYSQAVIMLRSTVTRVDIRLTPRR